MKFRSLLNERTLVSLREVLFRGLAPDGSLYVPEEIPLIPATVLNADPAATLPAIASQIIAPYIDDVPLSAIQTMAERAFDFPIPLVPLEQDLYLLELFHGPTLAFKDIGARFMASALSYFLEQDQQDLTIAVATSGDTGSAVAQGFFRVPRITVYVLYPAGRISPLQEQQITTVGENIQAVEVEGSFDDCQRIVKMALVDPELSRAHNLTTANSINLGRLIPQITYYFWALLQLRWSRDVPGSTMPVDICVPSGNFGNITAAAYAKRMGAPVSTLIAASNANATVPEYFSTGLFNPRASVQTYSNAMDVGNPSNFVRLLALYANSLDAIRQDVFPASISDAETLGEIRRTYEHSGLVLDPHSAVGVAAARRFRQLHTSPRPTIVAATAHPAKFPDVISKALGIAIPLPAQLEEALRRTKKSTRLPAEYARFKDLLLP
jgi:threonine synthase